MNKILSIIIPVYNTQNYLEECIRSIQTCKDENIEIIIINDGSTDNTPKICDSLAKEDSRIKVIHKPNSGVSDTRNYGIKACTGKWIMFVDADDYLSPNWYNDVSPSLLENHDILYISKDYTLENQKLLKTKEAMLKNTLRIDLVIGNFSSPCSKIYNSKIIKGNNILFNTNIICGEDMIFNISTLNYCNDVKYIPVSIYNYRIHISQSTKKFNEKFFSSDKEFLLNLGSLLNTFKIDDDIKNFIYTQCRRNAIYSLMRIITRSKDYNNLEKYKYVFEDKIYQDLPTQNLTYKDECINLIQNKKYKEAYELITNIENKKENKNTTNVDTPFYFITI